MASPLEGEGVTVNLKEKPSGSWRLVEGGDVIRHRDAWRALNARSFRSPVLDPDFIEPLLQIFGRGNERLAICGDPQRPRAMGLITTRKPGAWETFQPDQAPIAPWLVEPDLALEPLLAGLLRRASKIGLLVGITQQDPSLVPRPANTRYLRTLDYIQTARIPVTGDFESYWAQRGKNLRHNLRRQHNRLTKEGLHAQLEILQAPDEMVDAVADYGRIESAGWKAQAGTAVHPDNAQGRFYKEMLGRFAQRGQAFVFRYRLNGQVAAMDLCVLHDGILVILKTAYDENQGSYSPALLMREATFRWIFARNDVRTIEFYGRVMDWHRKWADDVRTMYHVNLYRWPFLPWVFPSASTDLAPPTGG